MSKNLKYSVGIDISKDKFDVCLSQIDDSQRVKIVATHNYPNTKKGFEDFHLWHTRKAKDAVPVVFTMEATGLYYEHLAHFLYRKECMVSVVLPNKSKRYLDSLGQKSKNDQIDAKGLAQMGAEKCLDKWVPPSEPVATLRSLTRQHENVTELKTMINNQIKAFECGEYVNSTVMNQLLDQFDFCEQQLSDLKKEIENHVNKHDELSTIPQMKIKGVGILTIATVVAETQGFHLINNIPQLVSYAGYDVIENSSGNHVGKTRISKKGNFHIRRILHLPAFNVVKEHKIFKDLYSRVYENTKIKMKGYVAVQRKLLIIIYTLWKKKETFNPECWKTEHPVMVS